MNEEIKIKDTPTGGYLLEKKTNQGWQFYYSISGPITDSCHICGYPIKEKKECEHHKGLDGISVKFNIKFIGYYQTNLQGNPLNVFTEKVIYMRSNPSETLFKELNSLLNLLYKRLKNVEKIEWGTWVPSKNNLLKKIAEQLFEKNNIFLIDPLRFIDINENLKFIDDRCAYVNEKYKLKNNFDKEICKIVNNRKGIIIDDLLHTGYTIGRIVKILELFNPKEIVGLVLSRTSKGKHPIIVKYPNLP